MSRKPSLVDGQTIELLKKMIQKKVNLPCTSFAEIQQLQLRIQKETSEYLSIQTLNRFFGLIKNEFKPAMVTLNILAKFLHYDSFRDFELANRKQEMRESNLTVSTELIRLMFTNIEADRWNDKSLVSIMRNLCLMLKRHSYMADDICHFMATTEYGRRCFYEQFINMDALDDYYGDGLKVYITQTKDREQLFFAYSLLALRYFLSGRYDQFNYYHNKVLEYPIAEIQTFTPSMVGRFYASQVLNARLNNEGVEVYDEAYEVLQQSNACNNGDVFPWAEFWLAESLILAKEYGLAWSLLKESRNRVKLPLQNEKGYWAQYELLELYAAYFSGNISERRVTDRFSDWQTKVCYFLSQDYYTFFSLQLSKALDLKDFNRSAVAQWNNLIEKTGFVYFRNGLTEFVSEQVVLMEIKGKKIG